MLQAKSCFFLLKVDLQIVMSFVLFTFQRTSSSSEEREKICIMLFSCLLEIVCNVKAVQEIFLHIRNSFFFKKKKKVIGSSLSVFPLQPSSLTVTPA